MLLSLDRIPRLHNILASFFTWVLLAGYIVFPATFTSLRDSAQFQNHEDANAVEKKILEEVKNAPLMYVAAFCCGVGCFGCIWLWWKWKQNYVGCAQSLGEPHRAEF
jgi:cytochrome bd-type quinol oxidase subunit 2